MTKDEHEYHIAWKGKSWHLYETKRTLPNGSYFVTAYIHHPGSVVIVPLRESGLGSEVLMLRQYRHSIKESILELPAGTRGWDEDLLICAQRDYAKKPDSGQKIFSISASSGPRLE